ncbi:integrase catalytic domain-containing protein, partial [Trichonephila clavipes]
MSTEFLAKIAQLSEFKAEIYAFKKEAVTDLTTEAFIAALKRFCGPRGRISTLMSDNATNFKGAAAELNGFLKLICNKNAKHYQILNSRPLVPLSDNINEYEVLTLGHFIIGRGGSIQQSVYKLFGKAGKMIILIIYSRETSGSSKKNNVAVGCLVLLKENDLLPGKWAMARILEVIYGTDEVKSLFVKLLSNPGGKVESKHDNVFCHICHITFLVSFCSSLFDRDSVLLAFVKNDNAWLLWYRRYSVDIFDLPLVLITVVW